MNDNEIKVGSEYKRTLSYKNIMARVAWNIVYMFLFRPFPTIIFEKWRNFILRIFGAKIGKHTSIRASAKIWAPWNLEIGENSCIDNRVNCYNPGKIKIGNKVVISAGAFICTPSHDISSPAFPMIPSTITIKDCAWIASEAFIGPKVTIGEYAVVGARACVFKDVEPWSVVGGNPAVFLKKRVIVQETCTQR